jgi:CheY-like chemotaxis protein
MAAKYIVDSGVLQGLNKELGPGDGTIHIALKAHPGLLFTIQEVIDECNFAPSTVLERFGIQKEVARRANGFEGYLNAFSSGLRELKFRPGLWPRADRAVFEHAAVNQYDIITTDGNMHERGFREFIRRIKDLPDDKLPPFYLPEFVVVRHLVH